MKKLNHSKFKNTGILFELLVRQIAADTMNNVRSKSLSLIKNYFKEGTDLYREYMLYKSLIEERFKSAELAHEFINSMVVIRESLDSQKLRKQKFNLIREINSIYDMNTFFQAKVSNYSMYANIYKLFEFAVVENPAEITRAKSNLLEHITASQKELVVESDEILDKFRTMPKEIRLMASKFAIDTFNDRYKTLLPEQKDLLRVYVNSVNDNVTIRSLIKTEIPKIRVKLTELSTKVTDKVTTIKLNEVMNMLNTIQSTTKVRDSHILTLMRYYSLIHELAAV